jgi:hypothetical protein
MKKINIDTQHFFNWKMFPIYFVDYVFVMVLYVSFAFCTAVLVDSYILPKYSDEYTKKTSSALLSIEVLLQFILQGFFVICIIFLIKAIPSPMEGVYGYNPNSSIGFVVRNPAIISIILLRLSDSLIGRLDELYNRFKNKR